MVIAVGPGSGSAAAEGERLERRVANGPLAHVFAQREHGGAASRLVHISRRERIPESDDLLLDRSRNAAECRRRRGRPLRPR